MVEQGLDEGVGLVVVALGCGKVGENIPCSHKIDGDNDAQGQSTEPETAACVALAMFDAFPDAAEILPDRPEDSRGHEQQAGHVPAPRPRPLFLYSPQHKNPNPTTPHTPT